MLVNLGLGLLSTVVVWRIARLLLGLLSNVAVTLLLIVSGVFPVVGVDVDSENATSQRYSRRSFSCVGKIRFQVQRYGFSDDSFRSS